MNKNKWGYKYNFNTTEVNKDWTGHYKRKDIVNSITFTTNLGKDYADSCYVSSLDRYCEDRNKKWFSFYFTGKTKESVSK